ncbi:glutamate ABC transporter substrate-binding protein [Kitasatospora sp. NPDC004723]|uniref:glutamate ABC transporter substrate-binding protein n=1 Tax=Kitasatospora sp. NPDC004723 TaxID=3154288 RepID=UPI0033B32135
MQIRTKNNQPGTSMQNKDHVWSGFDVLVGRRVVQNLGRSSAIADFSDVISGERETKLIDFTADLVVATYSITPERTDKVYFAGPYAKTSQGFMVRAGESWLRSLDDLKGRTVCSWGGTTSDKELRFQAGVKGYTVSSATDAQGCLTELKAGRADAVSTDQLILFGLAKDDAELAVVPEVTIGVPNLYGIGINKERYEDCIRIRDYLKDYVLGSGWIQDFKAELGNAGNPDNYLPRPSDFDEQSCKALPHQNQVMPSLSATASASASPDPSPTVGPTP